MTFQDDKNKIFEQIFENTKEKIRAMSGCEHLELWQDINNKNIYTTYSIWKSVDDLENYRNSELFETTWKSIKIFFKEKAVTSSFEKLHILP